MDNQSFMSKANLTIDDSPSAQTDSLTDMLQKRAIPALLLCRGDRLDRNPDPVVRAIQKGFVIGNHAWSHTRFSTMGFVQGVKEIEKTDRLIDAAYKTAGKARPGKYFRFPHLDRGCGGWVVDYNAVRNPADRDALVQLFSGGLNVQLTPPDAAMKENKQALQDWLRNNGFTPPPCPGITHSWFTATEVAQAVDSMFTFSTSDWMVTPRHLGKWPYKSVDDLKSKIDDDPFLKLESSAHIILAHDQDDLLATVTALIDHFLTRGFSFAPV
jgi:peptidoglycan/xylan/chitin deacetylase (PgdA/CDA1 family)